MHPNSNNQFILGNHQMTRTGSLPYLGPTMSAEEITKQYNDSAEEPPRHQVASASVPGSQPVVNW